VTGSKVRIIVTEHPKDVCECGDYRYQHEDGTGPCKFNEHRDHGGATHGFIGCYKFRLTEKAK
jgi:hypothetical protein